MVASTHERNGNGLTYDEWLALQELPEGFRMWNGSWEHWRQSDPLGWAVYRYKRSKEWNRIQWEKSKRARNSKKKHVPIAAT